MFLHTHAQLHQHTAAFPNIPLQPVIISRSEFLYYIADWEHVKLIKYRREGIGSKLDE